MDLAVCSNQLHKHYTEHEVFSVCAALKEFSYTVPTICTHIILLGASHGS